MISRIIGAIGVVLLAAACAQQPAKPVAAEPAPEAEEKAEPKPQNLPSQELTEQLLFEFLVGEVASQQGDYAVAVSAYLDLAQRTRDPRVAKRATELALQGRFLDPALKASRLWLELEPDSVQARQALAGLLLSQGRLEEARQHLEVLIASEEPNVGPAFMHLNSMLGRNPDRGATLALVRDLAKPYPRSPEAHFAVAQAALGANQPELASAEIKEALALRPDWEPAALFQGQLLQQRVSGAAALDFYRADIRTALVVDAGVTALGLALGAAALALLGPRVGITGSADVAGLPLLLLAGGAVVLVATPALNALSRAHERRADRYALDHTGNPEAFVAAMRRLGAQNLADERPSRFSEWFFHTHPPLPQRIDLARAWTPKG